ncbi:MAG: c-type cytochrome, partial [Verrucomicrobiales bacterium]|nr:c-type cytochrome [Verrucomicrobiales bacterium]
MRRFLLLSLLVPTLLLTRSAAAPIPGLDTSTLDPALKGHSLVEELNCVACHQSDALSPTSRKSPRLDNIASRLNPDYLQAFIADPHQTKPGTLMP